MHLVDTNIFIRFLTRDDPKKADRCFSLLESAGQGTLKLQTTETVVAEVVYILSSKRLYNLSRGDVYEKLVPILKTRGLKLSHKRIILVALEIYSKYTIDFEDAILIANMRRNKADGIYSYDRRFGKVAGVKRLEP